jgi:hypothetical protein
MCANRELGDSVNCFLLMYFVYLRLLLGLYKSGIYPSSIRISWYMRISKCVALLLAMVLLTSSPDAWKVLSLMPCQHGSTALKESLRYSLSIMSLPSLEVLCGSWVVHLISLKDFSSSAMWHMQ